jgi:hypothetical protein
MGKYIKFGLRADRNLSDLEDPRLALSNLLNDISSVIVDGAPAGFTTEDISPVFGLRNTGLADYATASGTSDDLLQLNGSLVEYTSALQPGVNREIQPRITIQDNINNARTILGANPWLNGGTGPKTTFIPSTRIKNTPTASTNGNSVDVSNISALGDNLYTTSTNRALFADGIVYNASFWNNGVFELGSKVYPSFPDSFGMVQWTGYLSGRFTQIWESTGLFLLEQDLVDDGTENNWQVLKNVYSTSITTGLVSWVSVGGVATLATASVKSICSKMRVTINSIEYEVDSVDEAAGTLKILADIGTGSVSSLTFTWKISNDIIKTGYINYKEPALGDKIRVRYTVWWPNPVSLGLPANTTYKIKRFAFSEENGERLPFTYLYPEYPRDTEVGVYSYEYFDNEKASPLKQSSIYSLRINDTASLMYTPPARLHNVVRGMTTNGTTVTPRTFTIADAYGRLEGTFTDCKVGDWLTFNGTFVCQIREVRSAGIVYVDKDVLTSAGFSAGQTITNGIVFENLGLIGLFRLNGLTATTGTLTALTGSAVPLNQVYNDYICMGIRYDTGQAGFQPLRIISTGEFGSNPKSITTSTYPGGGPVGTVLPASSDHICAVYASRGLEDLSSTLQCVGVYGREVKTTSTTGSSSIELTTNAGIAVNDYVQYAGVIPEGTRVSSINVDGRTIVLDTAITATLNAAATVVFIKAANYSGATNKEFCVIPLNTAPPFAGTDVGLITTPEYPNLTTVDLAFAKLDLTIPTSKITAYTTVASVDRYFPIKYGNITYRALVI